MLCTAVLWPPGLWAICYSLLSCGPRGCGQYALHCCPVAPGAVGNMLFTAVLWPPGLWSIRSSLLSCGPRGCGQYAIHCCPVAPGAVVNTLFTAVLWPLGLRSICYSLLFCGPWGCGHLFSFSTFCSYTQHHKTPTNSGKVIKVTFYAQQK